MPPGNLHAFWSRLSVFAVGVLIPLGMTRQLFAQSTFSPALGPVVGLSLGRGRLERSSRRLPEYYDVTLNPRESLTGRTFTASIGVRVGSTLGLQVEYTHWREHQQEELTSILIGPTFRFGKRDALLLQAALGRVNAPIEREGIEREPGPWEDVFPYPNRHTAQTSGVGVQLTAGYERMLWRSAGVQLLAQWTEASLEDSSHHHIRYDHLVARISTVVFLEQLRSSASSPR